LESIAKHIMMLLYRVPNIEYSSIFALSGYEARLHDHQATWGCRGWSYSL